MGAFRWQPSLSESLRVWLGFWMNKLCRSFGRTTFRERPEKNDRRWHWEDFYKAFPVERAVSSSTCTSHRKLENTVFHFGVAGIERAPSFEHYIVYETLLQSDKIIFSISFQSSEMRHEYKHQIT